MLDHFSEGRMIAGFARGYQARHVRDDRAEVQRVLHVEERPGIRGARSHEPRAVRRALRHHPQSVVRAAVPARRRTLATAAARHSLESPRDERHGARHGRRGRRPREDRDRAADIAGSGRDRGVHPVHDEPGDNPVVRARTRDTRDLHADRRARLGLPRSVPRRRDRMRAATSRGAAASDISATSSSRIRKRKRTRCRRTGSATSGRAGTTGSDSTKRCAGRARTAICRTRRRSCVIADTRSAARSITWHASSSTCSRR